MECECQVETIIHITKLFHGTGFEFINYISTS